MPAELPGTLPRMMAHIMLAAVLTTGCGSRPPAPSSPGPDTNSADEPWFCQMGEDTEDWECVQSEALARAPKPDRLPPPRPVRPPAAQPSASSAATAERAESAGTEVRREPGTPPGRDSTRQPQASTPAPTEVPRHVALSYQPDEPVSILELPGAFWAVQLVALSSKEALEAFARDHNVRAMSAARVASGDDIFYVLLLGIYETRANAEMAIEDLAPPFDRMTPWIRSMSSLQAAMQQADQRLGAPAS